MERTTIDSVADRSTPRERSPRIVVAAHDEGRRIEATLAALALAFPGAPVWVADDGSRDDTGARARAAGAVVVRSGANIGKGAAMTIAAGRALLDAPAGALFLLCDGDLGETAARLAPLVERVHGGEADLAVAAFTRSVGGGFGLARGFARRAIRRLCALETAAPISGQRALSARALATALPFASGFGMEIGMTVDVVRAGLAVVEVELDLAHRATGRTPAGFAHRARQLLDFARVYRSRRR